MDLTVAGSVTVNYNLSRRTLQQRYQYLHVMRYNSEHDFRSRRFGSGPVSVYQHARHQCQRPVQRVAFQLKTET